MSTSRRKFSVKHPVVVDLGCSCRRPKLSSFFFPSKHSRTSHHQHKYQNVLSPSTVSLTTSTTTKTSSTFSPNATSSPSPEAAAAKEKKLKQRKKGVMQESVAVEKESSDPYVDFRDSMLQMIVEKEIYNWDDLRELLRLFLSLNSPYHHPLILQAFAEIWNGVFSPGS